MENEEKRMISSYEVTQSIHIGKKEVVFGVDLKEEYPFLVCYCTYDNPLSTEWVTDAVGSDDYLEAMQIFTDRVQEQIGLVRAEQEQFQFDMTPFTIDDCIPDDKVSSIVGKVVVINAEVNRYEYRHSAYQLVLLVNGGHGARGGRGQAVFGTCLADGKHARWERYDVLGEIKPEKMPDWAKEAAASALEGKIARLKNKIDNLISMRADGEITKEEFKSLKDTTEAELNKYMEEKARMSELSNSESGMEFDTEKIRAVLEEALDFSKPKLDDSIIEKFVSQIIPVDNCRYRWDLNFLPNETQSLVCKVEGRKNHADATIEEGSEDEDESPRTYVLSMDYSNISVTAKNAYQSYVLHRLLLNSINSTFRS